MSILVPVEPSNLRRSALEAASAVVRAERSLLLAWHGVPLAPMPGSLRLSEPGECYPLGRWGSSVAELRALCRFFMHLGRADSAELWTAEDAEQADSQGLPGWRERLRGAVPRAGDLAPSEVRLTALGAARHALDAERVLAIHPEAEVLVVPREALRRAADELLELARRLEPSL